MIRKAKIGNKQISLEVLSSIESQKIGFMNRDKPDDSFGLFFLYDVPQVHGFWMYNVPFNLELLAFDENFKLFEIMPLKAMSLTTKIISKPCKYIIEVADGFSERHQIKISTELIIE